MLNTANANYLTPAGVGDRVAVVAAQSFYTDAWYNNNNQSNYIHKTYTNDVNTPFFTLRRQTRTRRLRKTGIPKLGAPWPANVMRTKIGCSAHLPKIIFSGEAGPNNSPVDVSSRRYRARPLTDMGNSSYSVALSLYLRSMYAAGQRELAETLRGILRYIVKRSDTRLDSDFVMRNSLKKLHDMAFPLVAKLGDEMMFFCHLHVLGGTVPLDKQEIIANCQDWMNNEHVTSELLDPYIERVLAKYQYSMNESKFLSFTDFCDDPLRWSTSGSAKKVTLLGEEHRTKLAWALSKINDDGTVQGAKSLFDYAKAEDDGNMNVALKFEAAKTRPVITAPMVSYLRQTYMAYRLGVLNINSPVANPNWLASFQQQTYRYYAAIDGDKFDHHVAKRHILMILKYFEKVSPQMAFVCNEEVAWMEKAKVRVFDTIIPWVNGMPSGCRWTGIIDSIISDAICMYICETAGYRDSSWGTMGDDIILFSNNDLFDIDTLSCLYNYTGMKTNISKTTVGNSGEFLRKNYSLDGILGYPAIAVKSACFKTAWSSAEDYTDARSISGLWMTLYSRFAALGMADMREWVIANCCQELLRWGGGSKQEWYLSLKTPVSAGGLGCIEWSGDWSAWLAYSHPPAYELDNDDLRKSLFATLGHVSKSVKMKMRKVSFAKFDFFKAIKILMSLRSANMSTAEQYTNIPKNVNITRTIFSWFFGYIPFTALGPALQITMPYAWRVGDKLQIIRALRGLQDTVSLTTTIHTPETASGMNVLLSNIVAKYLRGGKNKAWQDVYAASTLLGVELSSTMPLTLGTW